MFYLANWNSAESSLILAWDGEARLLLFKETSLKLVLLQELLRVANMLLLFLDCVSVTVINCLALNVLLAFTAPIWGILCTIVYYWIEVVFVKTESTFKELEYYSKAFESSSLSI